MGAEIRPAKKKSAILELPIVLGAALAVAVIIKTFLVQPFFIPSPSMVPTLAEQDRVVVSKIGDIEPGEIIVFRNPGHSAPELSVSEGVKQAILEAVGLTSDPSKYLIKRLIAVGGQTVEIHEGRVSVDGTELVEPYLAEATCTQLCDVAPFTLGGDQIWVMGDNRNHSSDSRVFGAIDRELLVGEALFRIWPLDRVGGL